MSEYDPLTHNEDLALKEDIASHEWALYCVVNVDKELIQQENFGNFNCSLFCFILLFYWYYLSSLFYVFIEILYLTYLILHGINFIDIVEVDASLLRLLTWLTIFGICSHYNDMVRQGTYLFTDIGMCKGNWGANIGMHQVLHNIINFILHIINFIGIINFIYYFFVIDIIYLI